MSTDHAFSPQPTEILLEHDVPVPMPDGAVLATDVYRPAGAGRFPVIVIRTAYHKEWMVWLLAFAADPTALVRDGYVVVVQDARGTGASSGVFRPFVDDGADGAATIAWAADQPWSSGAVGMIGLSYGGGAQLVAAQHGAPALRAIVPFVAGYFPELYYQGGAFKLDHHLPWTVMMGLEDLARREAAGEDVAAARRRIQEFSADVGAAYRRLPLSDLGGMSSWIDANYGEWLRHPPGRMTAAADRSADGWTFETPGLHITGWHDAFLSNALRSYASLRAAAPTEEIRSNHRLVVAPWGHGPGYQAAGEVWMGPAAEFDVAAAYREWLGAWLKGDPLPEWAPVRLFVQGINRWRDEEDWPLERAAPTRWHLREGGGLSVEAPVDEAPDVFRYDPAEPVPTVSGGALVGGVDGLAVGALRDRRRVHDRPDVLVYVSDLLDEDLEVTGPVTATLHVASSAVDTDVTVALIDVFPDGRRIGLTDGILRLRYRDPSAEPSLIEPGRVYEVEVDLIATSNVFLAGHRIAVEVSSSNFPRFDRHPNSGGVIAEATEADFVVATQTVYHDAARPSCVTLPVIPG
jgi:putative CocE/NonD family hydrolase